MFGESFFLQIKGTAMGKRYAAANANIYMVDWEQTVKPSIKFVLLCSPIQNPSCSQQMERGGATLSLPTRIKS